MYPTFQSGSVGGAQKPLYTDAQKKQKKQSFVGGGYGECSSS